MRNSIGRPWSGSAGFATSTVSTVIPMPEFYLGRPCVSVRVVSVCGGALVFVCVAGSRAGVVPVVSVLETPPVSVVSVFVGGGWVGGGAYCVPVVSVDVAPVVSIAIGLPNSSRAGGGGAAGECSGHGIVGCVPSLNASRTIVLRGQFGVARPPLVSSSSVNVMPGGGAQSASRWPDVVASLYGVQIGAAP